MSVRMNKLSEFKEVKSALRKPPHYNTKEYSNSKQQIARFTECVFQASSSGMLKTKAEATIMLRHAIEIRQVLQSIQVGGAHTADAFELAGSNRAPVLARGHEAQQMRVEVVVVEHEKRHRESGPQSVQLNERHDLEHLVQCPDSAWQAHERCSIDCIVAYPCLR